MAAQMLEHARKRKKLRQTFNVLPQSPTAILSKMISPQKLKHSMQMHTGNPLAKGALVSPGRTPPPRRPQKHMITSMDGNLPPR